MGVATADIEGALAAREAVASGDDPGDPRLVPADGERAASGASDAAAAARLLARRDASLMREPDLRKRRAKAYALLARAGFDPGTAGQASAAWLQAARTAPMDDEADQLPDP
jgi:hypothetical protein